MANPIIKDKMFQEQVINEYIAGESSIKLAKKYRVSKKWILGLLHHNNIKIKTIKEYSHFFNKIDKDSLVELYTNQELSLSAIARRYNTDHHVIARLLLSYGITKRPQIRHKCNNSFFAHQSRNMAYVLGFILADGCVRKGRILSFGVNDKDEKLLSHIKKVLRYTGPIRHWSKLSKTNTMLRYSTLTIHSKELVSDLLKFNIGSRKTGHEILPLNLEPKFYGDFLRGLFDGDGTIKKDGGQASICSASATLLNSVNNTILGGVGKLNVHIGKQSGLPYYSLYISRSHISALYNIMYGNEYDSMIYLPRKKQRFRINNE